MKKFQAFDMNSPAVGTKYFAIAAVEPDLGRSYVQISDPALGPAVNGGGRETAPMANRYKPLVGLHLDMSGIGFGCNVLVDNFDSTKGEIRCYSGYGHRRPPLDIVFSRR
jgi:hypothetical protein